LYLSVIRHLVDGHDDKQLGLSIRLDDRDEEIEDLGDLRVIDSTHDSQVLRARPDSISS
jgi:hypothetical protein